MFLGVVLQVKPEVVGEGVFVLHSLFLVVEESFLRPTASTGSLPSVRCRMSLSVCCALRRQRQRIEIECDRFAEADDEDALAVLRDEVRAVYDAVVDVVAKVVGQGAADDVEGAAFVVRDEVLDVLQQKGARAFRFDDARHVEEQRALRFAGETVRFAQRIFLGHSGNRKWLAGKSSQQHVVVGYVGGINLGDVSGNGMPVAEIFGIGFLRVAVPFAGVYAARRLCSNALRIPPMPANRSMKSNAPAGFSSRTAAVAARRAQGRRAGWFAALPND